MNIAVIGSSSFLGKNILQSLSAENISTILFSRQKNSLNNPWYKYNHPECPLNYDRLAKCETIYYCAGAGIQPGNSDLPSVVEELNFKEPVRLINNLIQRGYSGKLVMFGSYFEIGNNNDLYYYTEEEIINHSNVLSGTYGRSKHQLTMYISETLKKRLPFTLQHFILSNVYGYGENEKRLIPYLIISAMKGNPINLTSAFQVRQYTHVKDISNFLKYNLKNNISGIFNLSVKKIHSIKEVVDLTIFLLRKNLKITPQIHFGSVSKQDETMKFLALDISKLNKYFNFHPEISLEDGIKDYVINYGTAEYHFR